MILIFNAKTEQDFNEARNRINDSEWYAEFKPKYQIAIFPVDSQNEADIIEMAVQPLFNKANVDGYFEIE